LKKMTELQELEKNDIIMIAVFLSMHAFHNT